VLTRRAVCVFDFVRFPSGEGLCKACLSKDIRSKIYVQVVNIIISHQSLGFNPPKLIELIGGNSIFGVSIAMRD
jgi:hypothetical protein